MIAKYILIVAILLAAFNFVVVVSTMVSKEPVYTTSDRFDKRYKLVKKEGITLLVCLLYILIYIFYDSIVGILPNLNNNFI